MQAIRHHAFGPVSVLRLEQLPDLEPAADEVRIAVEAAGVHLLDTSIRAGESFGAGDRPALPQIPGREVAGVVDRVGDSVDSHWLGRRVVAHLGMGGGGYAEQAVVAADRAHHVPEGMDLPTAVAAIGTGRTAAAILDHAAITDEDRVAVTSAAGGLGVLLLQGAARAGAGTVGVAGGPDKVALVTEVGAEVALDRHDDAWTEHAADAGPFTVVLDGVGGTVGQRLYDLLSPGGRLVRYGWASGVQNAYGDPGRSVVDVLGPPILARIDEFERAALAAAADRTRVPYVGSVFSLAEAVDAHRALEAGVTLGKVVLRVPA